MSASAPATPPKSLLVVRLGAMGDVIHTMHAAALLRRCLPEIRIGWVIEERWAELLCATGTPRSGARTPQRPLVDTVHVVNTKSWRKAPLAAETRQQFSAALKEIRQQHYQLAIDFQGAIKSAMLGRLSRPQALWGSEQPRELPARLLYANRIPARGVHVIEQYCSLAQGVLGDSHRGSADLHEIKYDFPADAAADVEISRKLAGVSTPIVLLNPGAGWGAKQWPASRYGDVARSLANDGCSVLVNYGPGEGNLANTVRDESGGMAQPITCSIAELIALARRVQLFVGGDTGPLHLAAAMGVPVIAIFGPTDPARNGPFTHNSVVLRNAGSQTSLSHTSATDPGLLQIGPDEVLAAARTLLETRHA